MLRSYTWLACISPSVNSCFYIDKLTSWNNTYSISWWYLISWFIYGTILQHQCFHIKVSISKKKIQDGGAYCVLDNVQCVVNSENIQLILDIMLTPPLYASKEIVTLVAMTITNCKCGWQNEDLSSLKNICMNYPDTLRWGLEKNVWIIQSSR